MTRKALGRGLGALLSVDQRQSYEDSHLIQLDQIVPNHMQPRTHFDEAKLAELADSISANGLVQPLLVRRIGGGFELIAGERRWRAARLAGLTRVPAIVRDVPDDKLLELALIENIQREELNPIEEANAYKNLIETIGITQEDLARRVGRDRSYITNYLRLLKLPADLQQLVQEGKLSTGHARTILALEHAAQRRLAGKIIDNQLSVRTVEDLVKRELSGGDRKESRRGAAESDDANIRAAESKLRRQFGTKVRIIKYPGSSNGKIEIEFFGEVDLIRIYDLLSTPTADVTSIAGA
jgi:ParB family transcriptional regulator, chromosome partitioning protein